jgi:hypothetical protein
MFKHNWAHENLKTLDQDIKTWLRGHPYRIVPEGNNERTEYVLKGADIQPVPTEIRLAIGDILHNARSVLDHVAYEIALDRSNTHIIFPILTDPRPGGELPFIRGGVWCPQKSRKSLIRYSPTDVGQPIRPGVPWLS